MSGRQHIVFLGTCRSGLGHLRRISNIVAELAKGPNAPLVSLVTNAQPAGLPAEDLLRFSQVVVCDRSEMAAYLAHANPSLAVLDTMTLPGIGAFSGPAALILRETPEALVEAFRRDDGRPWACVLVPNTPEHWMPGALPGFARRIEAVGWILRRTGVRAATEPNAGILVATGGGGTEATRAELYPELQAILSEALHKSGRAVRIRQALGPRAQGHKLSGLVESFDPGGDLNRAFRQADLVISTAGYNSVLELASTDTPALIAPIPRSLDDQKARVRIWGPRLGFGLLPGTREAAIEWLVDHMLRPRRRAPVDLGPDGAVAAARILQDMTCPVS